MTVRPARRVDHREWLRMRRALWPEVAPIDHEAELLDALTQPGLVLVATDETDSGRLIGFLELSIRSYAEGCAPGPVPYVEGWYVDTGHRRQGVGAALVRAAEAWAREQGYREIASDTLLDNAQGQAVHRALGFTEVERSVHFRKRVSEE